jgi:hypothetical protein
MISSVLGRVRCWRQGPPGTAWLPSWFRGDLVFVGDVGVGEPGMARCRFSGNGGCGNTGNNDIGIGIGLTGNNQFGIGGLDSGSGNIGLFNSGSGLNVTGYFNSTTGNFVQGYFNTGDSIEIAGVGTSGENLSGFFTLGGFNTGHEFSGYFDLRKLIS